MAISSNCYVLNFFRSQTSNAIRKTVIPVCSINIHLKIIHLIVSLLWGSLPKVSDKPANYKHFWSSRIFHISKVSAGYLSLHWARFSFFSHHTGNTTSRPVCLFKYSLDFVPLHYLFVHCVSDVTVVVRRAVNKQGPIHIFFECFEGKISTLFPRCPWYSCTSYGLASKLSVRVAFLNSLFHIHFVYPCTVILKCVFHAQ